MTTGFEHVRYAVDDGIATLTLHRPDRLNAVNSAMLREVVEALDAAPVLSVVGAATLCAPTPQGKPE
jgi:enoyl-CoA hydratase/carnithine racemase